MPSSETTSPYPGPRPYTAADRERFHGRARELQDLAALVIAQPLVVLHGATGAGKTSLLCAGVVPELERVGFEVLPVARVGGLLPPGADATRLRNVFSYSVLLHWSGEDADRDALARHTLATFLRERQRPGDQRPLALVIDQLGDLFSAYPAQWEQREAFLREIAECLPSDRPSERQQPGSERPVRVLLAIRDEQLANLERHAHLLPDALRVRYAIDSLRVPEAIEAITGPAPNLYSGTDAETLARNLAQRRVRLANGKQALIASDRVEPMHIQLACEERWQRGGRAGPLSRPFDPDEALVRFYDAAVARARSGFGAERQIRRWIAERLMTPEGARTPALRGKKSSAGLANRLAENLEQERVIVAQEHAGFTWYELAHDRMVGPVQLSNKTWFEGQAKRRRAWRFVFFMLVFAGVVVGLTYLGQLGWNQWQGLQGDKKGLESQLGSLAGDKDELAKQLEHSRGELAVEQRRVLLTLLAADVQAMASDVQSLQGVIIDMGRYRPSARDVELEAETLINFFASGQALIPLAAQVEALGARQKALVADVEALAAARPEPELKPLFESLGEAADDLSGALERMQKSVATMSTDHAKYNPRLSADLDGWEAPPRPGSPISARVRELSRVQWRQGFRALLAGNAADARERFERALTRDPGNPAASDALARLAWSSGQVEEAEKKYREALASANDYAPALTGMADVYLHGEALADAERCVRKALTLQPDYGPAHLAHAAIGRLLAQPGVKRGKVARDNPCVSKSAAAEVAATPEKATEATPAPEPEAKPEPTPAAAAAPEPEAAPEAKPEPEPEPAPKAKPSKPKKPKKESNVAAPLNRDAESIPDSPTP